MLRDGESTSRDFEPPRPAYAAPREGDRAPEGRRVLLAHPHVGRRVRQAGGEEGVTMDRAMKPETTLELLAEHGRTPVRPTSVVGLMTWPPDTVPKLSRPRVTTSPRLFPGDSPLEAKIQDSASLPPLGSPADLGGPHDAPRMGCGEFGRARPSRIRQRRHSISAVDPGQRILDRGSAPS